MKPHQEQNFWQPEPGKESASLPRTEAEAPDDAMSTDEDVEMLTWEASEFVHHEKSGMWFLALLAVAVVLLVVDYVVIQSWTFAILIVVMALAAAVITRRPPRTLTCSLSAKGIRIDQKLFSYHDFRAFGVVKESAFYSVRLIPHRRFMPMVSVFFPTELGEQIVDVLGSNLPMEKIEPDPVDKLVEKIRF